MKRDFEMTEADLQKLMDASKPVTYMVFGGRAPSSPQENANAAWAELGRRMGFDPMSVESNGKGDRFFRATPAPSEPAYLEAINASVPEVEFPQTRIN